MPIHYGIAMLKLDEEVELLKKAGKRIISIVPTTIDHPPDNHTGVVNSYAIIFEDKDDKST